MNHDPAVPSPTRASTPAANAKATWRSGRLRALGVLAGLAVLALPALAEADANARLGAAVQARIGSRPTISVDARGLHLREVDIAVDRRTLSVERIDVRPSVDGLELRVGDLRLAPPSGPSATRGAAPPEPASDVVPAEAEPAQGHLARLVPRLAKLRGVPLRVRLDGSLSIDEAGVQLRFEDTQLDLDPNLQLRGSATASVRWSATASRPARVGERLELQFDADLPADRARISGAYLTSTLGRVDGRAEVRADRAALVIEQLEGKLELRAEGLLDLDAATLTARAEAWKLAPFSPWLEGLHPQSEALGIDSTVVDGEVHLDRMPDGLRAHFADFSVHGLRLDHHRISPLPVEFARLSLDGDLSVRRAEPNDDIRVELSTTLAHGTARAALSGHLSDRRVDLDIDIASMPCQGLLDSAPRGLLPALEGMRVAGEVEGQMGVHFEWPAVRDWAQRSEAGEQLPSPGTLTFSFPVVDSCRVLREAPGVDVDGLQGAYRHRFVGAGGQRHERVLAMGAPDYAPLATVPRLGRAFTILEDARFWRHDGFDREHIERAVWHDLGVGRFARGASTITQQTARNLWLGVDRSLGRKLQEAFFAARLERSLDKRRILELYMNIIELGPGIYGIEPAAQFYFGRPARDLNLIESLHLAALAPAPVRFAERFASGQVDETWRAHLEEQVRRLRIHGYLRRDEARAAKDQPLRLVDRTRP